MRSFCWFSMVRKNLIAEYVAPKNVDKKGYVKSGYFRSEPNADYIHRTLVDRLKKTIHHCAW
jgi:hypothetical protein